MSGRSERPLMDRGAGKPRSVLVVYDPSQAGITASVRGFHFQEPLANRGWRMEFLQYIPASPRSARRPWRECVIAQRARRFDVVYLLKVPALSLIRRVKTIAGTPVVFDLTDSLWNEAVGGTVWSDLDAILRESDAVFTCNSYDTAYASRFNRNTVCLPPYADVTEFQRARAARTAGAGGSPRIGWVGSPSTVPGIRNVAEPLDRVAEKLPGLTLRVVGCRSEADLPPFRHLKVSLGPASYDQRTMIEEILDMDVGIYPIVIDEEDYCVRGPLKALNYMAGGVPSVSHRAGDVARIVENGRNGMLAATPEEWESRLETLLRDSSLRREMGLAGLATVRASYSFEGAVEALDAAFAGVAGGKRDRSALAASVQVVDQIVRATAQTVRRALVPGGRER